jgi:UDPglucose 6-dehydrogenase
MKVGFIGIGKLGKDVAEVMYDSGHEVFGYDIHERLGISFEMKKTIKEVCFEREIIFIAVPTPHDPLYDGKYPTSHLTPKDFNYDIVKDVLTEVNKHTNQTQLVVLISTVLPGTIRKDFISLCTNFRFIYNPYLIAMGTVKEDMVKPEMIIIGTEDGSLTGDAKLLLDFYNTIVVKTTRCEVGTWDEAEAIKIFYNTFISTKVTLVNMIQDVAEKNGNMNVDVVTEALERSTQRILGPAYMKAGMGDGGGCHPRDNIALRTLSQELGYDIFDSIMRSREKQAENLAKKLETLSKDYQLPVIILGKSYKPDVDYTEGSTSILTGYYLEKNGVEFKFDSRPEVAVYLLAHRGKFYNYPFPDGSIVLDVWREFKTENKNIKIIQYGNTRNQWKKN